MLRLGLAVSIANKSPLNTFIALITQASDRLTTQDNSIFTVQEMPQANMKDNSV